MRVVLASVAGLIVWSAQPLFLSDASLFAAVGVFLVIVAFVTNRWILTRSSTYKHHRVERLAIDGARLT